jgi:hypothetical protein
MLKVVLNKRVSFLYCSKIWLNLPVYHCDFGYITKLTPPIPPPPKKKKKTPKKTLKLSIKSWPVGFELKPSFDGSSPPGCCLQCHEILLS